MGERGGRNTEHYSFIGGSDEKESACNKGDLGLTPGSGRSLGEGNGNPLQYSWPGEFHGQKSLVGYSSWGCKESDMTEHRHVYVYVYTYIYVPMYLYVCLCAYRYTEIASRLFMFVYKCPSQPFFPLTNHHLTVNISQLRSSSSVKCSR